jgi:hypothetical protein
LARLSLVRNVMGWVLPGPADDPRYRVVDALRHSDLECLRNG